MRQAPDIILIGEIRDLETMRMALTYALSGHLCLATLHANNGYQAMNRVISFFPLEVRPMLLQDLSVSLKAVISQRLIKTIDGGRTPAVEVLLNTRNIQELIEKGEITEIKEAMEKSMSPGSQTFEQDLFRLVRQGKISTDEALANADSATNLGLLLGNSGIMPAATERAKQRGSPAHRARRRRPSATSRSPRRPKRSSSAAIPAWRGGGLRQAALRDDRVHARLEFAAVDEPPRTCSRVCVPVLSWPIQNCTPPRSPPRRRNAL